MLLYFYAFLFSRSLFRFFILNYTRIAGSVMKDVAGLCAQGFVAQSQSQSHGTTSRADRRVKNQCLVQFGLCNLVFHHFTFGMFSFLGFCVFHLWKYLCEGRISKILESKQNLFWMADGWIGQGMATHSQAMSTGNGASSCLAFTDSVNG